MGQWAGGGKALDGLALSRLKARAKGERMLSEVT